MPAQLAAILVTAAAKTGSAAVFLVIGVVILLGGIVTMFDLGGAAGRLGRMGQRQNEQSPLNHGVSTPGGARIWGGFIAVLGAALIAFAVTR